MNKRSSGGSYTTVFDVGFGDTITSLFGTKETRDHEKLRDNPAYKKFQEKFNSIFDLGQKYNVPDGEIQVMIHKAYGISLDETEFGRIDELRDFVEKNINQRYAFINPEIHAYLLRCGYYQQSATSCAPKFVVAKYSRQVLDMMNAGCSTEKHLQFGIDFSKTGNGVTTK